MREPRPYASRLAWAAGLLSLAVLCLVSAPAAAVVIYGQPQALPGAGGCLLDPLAAALSQPPCPGVADGLAGAQALALSPDGTNVYVAGEGGVAELLRDATTGALRPARSPSADACIGAEASGPCALEDAALGGADALAVSPDGRFVYVGASDTAAVSAFARGPNGVLTPLPRSAGGYAGCVAGIELEGTPPAPCAAHVHALRGVDALAISPDGRYLYALSYGLAPGTDSIVTIARNRASGALKPLGGTRGCLQSRPGRGCEPVADLEGASAITISPDGRFVYVASELSGAVRAFARNRRTGLLKPLEGRGDCVSSPGAAPGDVACVLTMPELDGARALALSPNGRELYVAAFDPGAVVTLERDPKSGRIEPGPSDCLQAQSSAACPDGLAFLRGTVAIEAAPDGLAVYALSEGGNSIVELERDPAYGGLSLAGPSPSGLGPLGGPAALALARGGGSLYIASPFDDGVAALAVP